MKWYVKILLAAGLSLTVPAAALAQPAPAKQGAKPAAGKDSKSKNDKGKNDKGKNDKGKNAAKPGAATPAAAKPGAATPATRQPPVQPFPNAKPYNNPRPVPADYRADVHGMHPNDFADLLNKIDRANFKNDRIQHVRNAAKKHKVTSEQVRTILEHLDFENSRIDAACALYPVVVDRKNWDIIYSALQFASSRERIHNCIR